MKQNLFKSAQYNQAGIIVTIDDLQKMKNIDNVTFNNTFGNQKLKYIIGPILGLPLHNLNQHALWQNISDVGLYVRKDANTFELLPASSVPPEVAATFGVPQVIIESAVQHTMPLDNPGSTYPLAQSNNQVIENNTVNTEVNAPPAADASTTTTQQSQVNTIKKQYCPDLFDYNSSNGVSTLKANVKQMLEQAWMNSLSKQPNYANNDPIKVVKQAFPMSVKMQKLLFLASTCKAGIFNKDPQYNTYTEKDRRYENKPLVINSVFENNPEQCTAFHQFMYRLQVKLKSIQGGSATNWKNWQSATDAQGPVKP